MDEQIAKYIESIPGFRYHPTNEELMLALKSMILGTYDLEHGVIFQFDVCKHEPWDLAGLIDGKLKFKSNSREWFCFNRQTNRYKNSKRITRTAGSGYWKLTGKKRDVIGDDDKLMGFKQTLVFHQGRVNKGVSTGWIMHEYHLEPNFLGDISLEGSMPFVVCRIKSKKDKKETKPCSIHKQDHAIDMHDKTEDYPVSSPATPCTPLTQAACNTWSALSGYA